MGDFLLHKEYLCTFTMVLVSPYELLTLFKSLENDEVNSSSMTIMIIFISSTSREQPFELCNISIDHFSTVVYMNCYF